MKPADKRTMVREGSFSSWKYKKIPIAIPAGHHEGQREYSFKRKGCIKPVFLTLFQNYRRLG